jgi:hypothetical protein
LNKRVLIWIFSIFIAFSSVAILTVRAAEGVFGTLPLVNAAGRVECLGIPQQGGDGGFHIVFKLPSNRDYVLESVQFLWKIPEGNPPTTVAGDFHILSQDLMTSQQIALFNNVTVSNTTPQLHTLSPDSNIVMQAGREYVIQFWITNGGGGCTLSMEASDRPPTGDFTFKEYVAPQIGSWIGFQVNATPLGSVDEDSNIVYPPDDRVNWQFGDDVAVIFSVNDSENNPALHVYQPATEGVHPHRPLVITRADLPKPMPPAITTWIAEEGLVNVYVLATGEIQFNIGPTWDGKVRVVIYPDFTGEGAYGYEYNIYDEVVP